MAKVKEETKDKGAWCVEKPKMVRSAGITAGFWIERIDKGAGVRACEGARSKREWGVGSRKWGKRKIKEKDLRWSAKGTKNEIRQKVK